MRWLQFILSHSIFISFCAAALCYQTFLLLHVSPNIYIYGLIFFATLASYNFYWLISKYSFTSNRKFKEFFKKNFSNLFLFFTASAGLFYCVINLPGVILSLSIAVMLTLLYSVPLWPVRALYFTRKAGFLKTVLLAFTWTYVTVMIPLHQSLHVNSMSVGLLFTARFLFILILCIIFDSRDIDIDKIHALRSLATDVSRRMLRIIMTVIFSLYLATGFFLRFYFNDYPQVIAFLITGMATLIVYRFSLKKQGYFFYYFLVDGLMLFSALATFVASI